MVCSFCVSENWPWSPCWVFDVMFSVVDKCSKDELEIVDALVWLMIRSQFSGT